MQAVLLRAPGGPEALELVDLPSPALHPGHVRVQARAIGVGRPDVMIRTGKYKWMPPLPAIIGNELAGTVTEVGEGVTGQWLGRPVLVSARELAVRGGCYAEEVVVAEDALIALPAELDFHHAVALPNYQLAWGLLHDACRGRLPDSVYLNGAAGGVGTALLQLCVQLGIRAIAGASTPEKRAFALDVGAAAVVDTQAPAGQLAEAVLQASGGAGVGLVLDHAGGPKAEAHLHMLAPFGLLVSYNAIAGPSGDLYAALRGLASKALGVVAYNMHAYNGPAMRSARRALMATPMDWMASGRLVPRMAGPLSLAQVRTAHERLDARDILGKLTLAVK